MHSPTIKDQRSMRGLSYGATPEDVRHDARNFLWRRRKRIIETGETVRAFISDSRWVADCPNCNGGIAVWPANPEGFCLDCGCMYAVEFPPADEVEEATAVLLARPDVARNWHPHRGEDVGDLKAENLLRGVPLRAI